MNKQTLREIIIEQKKALDAEGSGVGRDNLKEVEKYFSLPHAVIIAGIRRAGKSTFLRQIMQYFKKEGFYYFNFEDERLIDFYASDFNVLYEIFIELYGDKKIFFFDEIQNVKNWERFVRRMSDAGHKFFLTGSNASLLSRELGTRLTGRHIAQTLFPFSFSEYLAFKDFKRDRDEFFDTKKRGIIKGYFNDYLREGGMPEYLCYGEKEALKKVYNDILYRDIVARYDIRDVKALRELALYLASNLGSLFSYNGLKKFLGLGSANTAKAYVDYLENSFLFFSVEAYVTSLKKQIVANKKIYCADNGLADVVAFRFSEDRGKYLENLVFLELKRRKEEVYYYKTENGLEVDFLLKKGIKPTDLIQVCWNMEDKKTEKRELTGLLVAMEKFKLKKGLIITEDQEETRQVSGKSIQIIPAWKWLLEN